MKNNWRVALAAQRATEDAALVKLRAAEDADDERAEAAMLIADPAVVAYQKAVELVLRRGSVEGSGGVASGLGCVVIGEQAGCFGAGKKKLTRQIPG